MNLTINELERRLDIDGRLQERAALLEFETAWDSALDEPPENGDELQPHEVTRAPYLSGRTGL